MRNPGGWRSSFAARAAGRFFNHAAPYLPAFVVTRINYLLSDWVYVPEGWRAQRQEMKGWTDPDVADAVARHWPTLVRNLQGPGPLGVSHFPWSVTRDEPGYHNAMMSYGYVLALAAMKKDNISLLDWGGGAGHY